MIPDFDRLLRNFGLSGAYRRVTLGKGVVGKSTSSFLGLCGVFGLVAVGLIIAGDPRYLVGLAVLAAIIYLCYQWSVISFAKSNPASALLEGADFVSAIAPDWLRYSFNCWIVWTSRPASDFLYTLKPIIGQSDSVLIVKLDMSERNGWEPLWVWEWMDKKRQLGPPPPPAPPPADLQSLLNQLGGGSWPQPGTLGQLLTPPSDKKK
jgi:hypothetical protein